ncbi:hypothetical protein Tsubulata_008861 [Turnera subulata]|uniref:Nucleotide-diphospho-sugar transferase domain-containing protein n=1 Tax=Turnera subulata TaxID=218843 RepID=A0A9Q0J1C9_9ROSI|nr:hypothetical protein Tsubulata_008861 [Turnera subulata]
MVGAPKKHFLPLLLFISLFALFFFSHYHNPSLPNPNPNFTPTETLISQNPTQPFTFLIKVLAFNRLDSLSRCLRSLSAAHYGGDTVHLHIYIDHFPPANDSSDLLDQKLEDSRRILDFADGFDWPFGGKAVHYRTANAGLQAQWLEAWWPSSDREFAFVVEDDLEVSPLFYKFVKAVILNYYYNATNSSPFIYGVSLQRPRFVPGKHGNKMRLEGEKKLFLYQLVGTWGQILFPKPWKEFRLWYDQHKTKGIRPFLDGMVTNGWYKKMGERIWTPWFIKFVHSRGYFNIYSNFQHERALSVSHRDAGVNYGKTAGPDSQLLSENSLDFNLLEMPSLSDLRWYDFCFREVFPGRVVRTLDELGPVLMSVQRQQTVMLVSVYGALETIIRNLLCHFERLGIRNYIFIGPQSDLLSDLARRGHPVIDADQLIHNIRESKSMRFQDSSASIMKDILVKAYVIKKCLDDGYNSWIVDANVLFVSNDMPHELVSSAEHFYAWKGSQVFSVRNSSAVKKLWGDGFLEKVAAKAGQVSSPQENKDFVDVVLKVLQKNGARISWVDEASYGMKIGANSFNQTSLEAGKKVIYWSGEMSPDVIQKRLGELNMWIVDGDYSCSAVVCTGS